MKRVLAFISVVALVLGMTVTSFADETPSITGGIITNIVSVKDKDGNDLNKEGSWGHIIVEELPKKYDDLKEYITSTENLKNELGDYYEEGMQVVDLKNVRTEGTVHFPAEVVFKAKGIEPNTKVIFLQYDFETKQWNAKEAFSGDGTLRTIIDFASPFAFVAKFEEKPTSPQTGTFTTNLLVCGLVVVGAAGVLVFSKKRA